jgi:glycosyltransferase involved in cell wall biosynthesis
MTNAPPSHRTFWVDVEDFFGYFEANPRPSGIQRLVFEILRVLPERAQLSDGTPRIALVRHTCDDDLLREVTFESMVELFDQRCNADRAEQRVKPPARIRGPWGKRLRFGAIRQIDRLPPGIAGALLRAGVLQITALRYARRLATAAIRGLRRKSAVMISTPVQAAATLPVAWSRFAGQADDVLLILGAPWAKPDYGALLQRLRMRYQLRTALLLYDLIPVRRPEWCAAALVKGFAAWLETTLPHCDLLMAISQATAADLEAYAREAGVPLCASVKAVPIGTRIGPAAQPRIVEELLPQGLPASDSYVLFVSTLEARKNHALLFRVWRRLMSELPHDQVPTLVFAGRVGWLVADLLQQLDNTNWLDGKIRLVRDPTDAELVALYRGCQFTLFPSLFEGWGLPVSESLALGRPCIASNRTSLPEAGGELARYFDPENLDDAYRVVRDVIEHPAELEAWRKRVAHEFRHVPWEHTADAILAACPPRGTPAPALLEKTT